MARIPLGNAGNRMPGQTRAPQIAEAGASTGRALQQLGAVGVQTGLQKERDELQVQWQEHEEQKRAAEAAARAEDTAKLLAAEDRLRDESEAVSTGVLQGSIPKDEADKQWNERSQKIISELLPSMREQARPLAQPHLTRITGTLGNGVRKARERRDRQDVTTNLDAIFETAQRGYARDAAGMTALVENAVGTIGGQSLYTPEQLARKVQAWKEGSQYAVASAAIGQGVDNPKALASAKKLLTTLSDLDPRQRAELENRIVSLDVANEQKAAARAQKAEAAAARRMREAEAASRVANDLAAIGMLNPAESDRLMRQMSGTVYAEGFRAVLEAQRTTGPLASQSTSTLRATLDTLNAQLAKSVTPELKEQRDRVQRVLDGQEKYLREEGGLRAGVRFGWIDDFPSLDLSGSLADMAPQLRQRVQRAEAVGSRSGRNESPLTPIESLTLKQRLDTLPAREKSQFISGLAAALGPRAAGGLAEQLDKKDRALALAFAKAGDMTTEGRLTSELILKGQAAKADGTSTKGDKAPDVKASAWRAQAAAALDGVFTNQQQATQLRDAAEFIMHGIAAEQGGRLSKADMDRAVGLALGGTLHEHNGRKIPLPAGKTPDDLERSLSQLKPEQVAPAGQVRVNGIPMPAADFVRSLPGQRLVPVRQGEYAVEVNGRYVVQPDGAPVIIRLN